MLLRMCGVDVESVEGVGEEAACDDDEGVRGHWRWLNR